MDERGHDLPPNTYCYPRAFRPAAAYSSTPGLGERIQILMGAGRFRSALDILLPRLDHDPDDQEALTLALLVVGGGRTQQLQAVEPLGPRYLYDPRLDPLFAICTRCGNTWASSRCLLNEFVEKLSVTNPAGMQCSHCGYVLCRECVERVHLGIDVSLLGRACPACKRKALRAPVYPTGRPLMQLPRRGVPVSAVVVFREGPVPPGPEYVTALLEARSPEALNARAEMIGLPLDPWPGDPSGAVRSALEDLATRGRVASASLDDADAGLFQDERGLKVYLVQLYATRRKMAAMDARARLAERLDALAAALPSEPPGPPRFMKGLIVDHLRRVTDMFSRQPNYADSAAVWLRLLDATVLARTCSMLEEALREAVESDGHRSRRLETSDLVVIASAIPRLAARVARAYFPAGYLKFQEELGMPVEAQTRTVAHWIVCCNGQNAAIHLTCLPVDTRATLLLATDLLRPSERTAIGLQ